MLGEEAIFSHLFVDTSDHVLLVYPDEESQGRSLLQGELVGEVCTKLLQLFLSPHEYAEGVVEAAGTLWMQEALQLVQSQQLLHPVQHQQQKRLLPAAHA